MSFISILFAHWIIYGTIKLGYAVIGWLSGIVSTLFSTGMILIVLGIIGIYLGRIFEEVKRGLCLLFQNQSI
jgi:hypothetical protein